MISDVLFDSVESLRDYQKNTPHMYGSTKPEIDLVVNVMLVLLKDLEELEIDRVKFGFELNKALQSYWEESCMPTHGFVYLVKYESVNGLNKPVYKIGKSTNPPFRDVHTYGLDGTLIHAIETNDYDKLESEVHKSYRCKRLTQEIFVLDQKNVDDFCSIKRTNYKNNSCNCSVSDN